MNLEVRPYPFSIPPPHDDDTVFFMLLSGTSESGKSAFGLRGYETGKASRIKYLRVAAEASGRDDPFGYIEASDPGAAFDHAAEIWRRIEGLTRASRRMSCVESLKHPQLVVALSALIGAGSINARFQLVYTDAPSEVRVRREAERTGYSLEDTLARVRLKDEFKATHGLSELSAMADLAINNSGSLEQYMNFADSYFAQVEQAYPSNGEAIFYA